MSLELCILASGSSGNCSVLRTPSGVVLIDVGIGPRTAGKRLVGTGVALSDVRAICLTHLDSDHFNANWIATICKLGIPVYCHESRRDDVIERGMRWMSEREQRVDQQTDFASLVHTFNGHPFNPLDQMNVRAIPLAHDEHGSHGFLIEGFGQRIGYATDLGRVPTTLLELFQDVDVLALESNHDPDMQRHSGRPWYLQQRIMGGRGHLSNEQALGAIRVLLDRAEARGRSLPSHIVLLHRSRQCNCPSLVRRLFCTDARIAPRLTLSDQYERTEWLRPRPVAPAPGEQLTFSWG